MLKYYLLPIKLSLILSLLSVQGYAQETLARFTVNSGPFQRSYTPVSASLAGLQLQLESFRLQLYEIDGTDRIPVAAQVQLGEAPTLFWILAGATASNTSRSFELVQSEASAEGKAVIELHNDGGAIVAEKSGKPVFHYKYTVTPAPEGVSDRYARGGYFHPLYAPNGSVLTRIQPSDHYHHYGLWNPWTHTEFKGREIDFWNLYKAHGTIEVNEVPIFSSGPVFGAMEARQSHVVFEDTTRASKETALHEKLQVKVWNTGDAHKATLMDHTSTYTCATTESLTLTKYRYQGFGFRARASWNDANTFLLTSEGKNKKDGNSTRARWCIISGPTEQGNAGVLFLTYPSNYNYPELIRIWPEGANNGEGNVFFNFNPTMDRNYKLESGKQYALKYRMVLFEGEMSAAEAEQYWQDFSHPPRIEISYP